MLKTKKKINNNYEPEGRLFSAITFKALCSFRLMSFYGCIKTKTEKKKRIWKKMFYRLSGLLIVYFYHSMNEAEMIKCFPTIVDIVASYAGGYLNFNTQNS